MSAFKKYLNEHISGTGAALHLLQVLAKKSTEDRSAYEGLHKDILANRRFLEKVMAEAGFTRSRSLELAARATALFMSWRFSNHGLERGGMGLVEALETLELGHSWPNFIMADSDGNAACAGGGTWGIRCFAGTRGTAKIPS